MNTEDGMRILYFGVLVAALGSWALVEYRGRLGQAARSLAAWLLIIIAVAAGYGLWHDLRGRSVIAPAAQITGADEITIPRADDGHYYLTLAINGRNVQFMADTGASNVVLSQDDARALGFDPGSLFYAGQANTANGTVNMARVTLENVTLGPFQDDRITAWVNQGQMSGSLLGMAYLGQFRIELAGDRMILRR